MARRTARAYREALNRRIAIHSYENYVTDPTRPLSEHLYDIYERCMTVVNAGMEIMHIEAINNLIHSLPPQWGDMGVTVRDEMLEGNPNLFEFERYCHALIDLWDDVIHEEPEEEPLAEEEDPEEEPEDDLENDPEPEPQVEMDIESGPEAEDSSEDEAPPKKIRRTYRD